MKIGIITSNLRQGGVTTYTDNLISILNELGHSCKLYTGNGNVLDREVSIFEVLWKPSKFKFCQLLDLFKDFEKNSLDHIVVQNSWAIILFKLFYKYSNVTYMSHGWHWRGKVPIIKGALICFENFLHLKRRRYIFISDSVMYDFQQHIMFSQRHFAELIQNSVPSMNANSAHSKKIVVPMRADISKDHKNAFNLAVIAKEFDFVFCGEGVNQSYWLEQCEDHIPSNVILLDAVRDMQPVYSDALAVLLLSHFESLPLVLIEAMSCGIPCVSSDVGSVRSVLSEFGLIVKSNDDYETIIDYLKRLRTDFSYYKEQSTISLWKYEENFSYDLYKAKIANYISTTCTTLK